MKRFCWVMVLVLLVIADSADARHSRRHHARLRPATPVATHIIPVPLPWLPPWVAGATHVMPVSLPWLPPWVDAATHIIPVPLPWIPPTVAAATHVIPIPLPRLHKRAPRRPPEVASTALRQEAPPVSEGHAPPVSEGHAPPPSEGHAPPPAEAFWGSRETSPVPETPPAPESPPPPSACFVRLTSGLARAQAQPTLVGAGECGATDVVTLEAILLPDERRAAVVPPATLRCSMAEALAQWVREDVAPALAGPLVTVDNYGSYECRGRDHIQAAKLSEHGLANAIDIRGFVLANGHHIELTDTAAPLELRGALRASACARFTTVLGPGSDGFHEQHIHLDLAERHSGYRICQWDVRAPEEEVPLPPTRPAEAPARVEASGHR
jgi:hypothetical protein